MEQGRCIAKRRRIADGRRSVEDMECILEVWLERHCVFVGESDTGRESREESWAMWWDLRVLSVGAEPADAIVDVGFGIWVEYRVLVVWWLEALLGIA